MPASSETTAGAEVATSTAEPSVASTSEVAAEDPYEVWLATAPADAPDLSRDDAQLRAMLGCGTAWAPGTVDGVLQVAYASLVEQWNDQGLCEGP